MKEIGREGQQKLKGAKVLCIGAGGLGSPILLYLAGAGIGTLGIVDGDSVDESNLHRQVIHTEATLNMSKVESAAQHIRAFNSRINVVTYPKRFSRENAAEILAAHDWAVVVDGSDNAPTRYLVSDACVIARKPLVSGSAL